MNRWSTAAILAVAALGAAAQSTDAEVRKVDPARGKLTLKHAEVKRLDMPAMTMVFRVSNPALLEGLAVGDKLQVEIDKVDGQYTVTALRKVR